MPLKEHAFPAMAIMGDITKAPPLLAAPLPVDTITDQVGCHTQRQGRRQSLMNEILLNGRKFFKYGLFCKKVQVLQSSSSYIVSDCVKQCIMFKRIPLKFLAMLCRQRFDKQGTVAKDQSRSSAMILLIFLKRSVELSLWRIRGLGHGHGLFLQD